MTGGGSILKKLLKSRRGEGYFDIVIVVLVVVMVIALIIALVATNIIGMLCSVTAFIGAGCFVPFVGGLYWKKGTAKGAIAASIVGMIAMVLHWLGIIVLPLGEVGGAVCSLAAYIVVSLATQKDNAAAGA